LMCFRHYRYLRLP